jgi:cytochrome P450
MVRSMLYRIAATTTGIDGVDTPERTERFRHFIERLGESATVEWSTRDHDEVIREGLAVRDEFVEEFLRPAQERRRALIARVQRGELAREELPTDLVTLLELHWDEQWDEALVWRETCLFLVASTQTTSHALPHVIVHLTDWVREHPHDAAKVTDPEFLKAASFESLRLHQPAPTLLRIAAREVTLASGRRIPAGERVALFFTPANREHAVFGADPGEFNLTRELPPGQRPWGLTFGSGVHVCIGRPLVTGLSPRIDAESGTLGILVRILKAFYDAGVELDPDDPPERNAASHHDSYQRFPVIFRAL